MLTFAPSLKIHSKMKLFEFTQRFPDEASCESYLKAQREKSGIVCKKCGCRKNYWDSHNKCWRCSKCGHETTLTADTVMHNSKLPLMYWFKAIHLLTSTKNTFSASEMQRQLGHKRYQPIWEMMHKLRDVMGKRDSKYTLLGSVEVDEGFFSTEIPDKQKNEPLKRGAGSQAKTKVLVMAESTEVDNPKKGLKPKKVGHIKMVVIPDSKKETIDPIASTDINGDATVVSDGTKSHINFPKMFSEYVGRKIDSKEIGKVLPWVHIAISNSKSLMKNIYHGIKPEFLQEYLNEFCYKFNRRYFGDKLFDRLMIASIACTSEFEHRIYNRNLSAGCG